MDKQRLLKELRDLIAAVEAAEKVQIDALSKTEHLILNCSHPFQTTYSITFSVVRSDPWEGEDE